MLIHSQNLNPDEPDFNDFRDTIAPGEQLPKFSGYMTSTHDAALKPHMLCQSFCKSRFSRTNMRWELFIYFWVKCPVQYIMYFSANHRTRQPSVIGRDNVLSEKILGVGVSSKNQRLVVYWMDYSNKVIWNNTVECSNPTLDAPNSCEEQCEGTGAEL